MSKRQPGVYWKERHLDREADHHRGEGPKLHLVPVVGALFRDSQIFRPAILFSGRPLLDFTALKVHGLRQKLAHFAGPLYELGNRKRQLMRFMLLSQREDEAEHTQES